MANWQASIPLAMKTRKFYCHKCGTKLETKAKFRTIKRGDPDYGKYSRARRLHAGDIELTEYDFFCPSCKNITEFQDQRVIERVQKLAGKHTISEQEMDKHIKKAKVQLAKKDKIRRIVKQIISTIIIILVLWRWLESGEPLEIYLY